MAVGLELFLDEAEGFAFLKQIPNEDDPDPLPRLIPKRPLGFLTSLICVLLRKRLAEHDASTSEPRLIITEEEVFDMVKAFIPERAMKRSFMMISGVILAKLQKWVFWMK